MTLCQDRLQFKLLKIGGGSVELHCDPGDSTCFHSSRIKSYCWVQVWPKMDEIRRKGLSSRLKVAG